MENNKSKGMVTNILLVLIFIVLVVLIFSLKSRQFSDRYDFQINTASREIYVFDNQTGCIFITSAEIIGNYSTEVWTKLDPVQSGKTLSFKEFLANDSASKLRKNFIQQKKKIEQGGN